MTKPNLSFIFNHIGFEIKKKDYHMQILLGAFFHLTDGAESGSFCMPYKKVTNWNWESFWIIGGLFSDLGGTLWSLKFFFYGMGESKLGNGAGSRILHMAFIILVANIWGILLKEWNGVSLKKKLSISIGITTIITSVILVCTGNSHKQ